MHRPSAARKSLPLLALSIGLITGEVFLSSELYAKASDSVPQYLTPEIFADIAEKTLPSVVSVYVKVDIKEQVKEFRQKMDQFKDFFDDPQMKEFFKNNPQIDPNDLAKPGEADPHGDAPETKTSGSGVIISKDGYVVTNNHIVGTAKEGTVSVVLNDDTEIAPAKIKVIATDSLLDIAILKIDATGLNLVPIPWGNSDEMRIGDWVLAIGNPLDLRGSVSKGIISAKARKIGKVGIEHLLQTDAMINPGNSGGALVNLKGELIGVNMAIATNSGFFQGIGFAIPSNDAKFITDQVIKDGKIRRGYIGIFMNGLEDKTLKKALGLGERDGGILVDDVVAGAPAAEAGVKAYDVITSVDGVKVKDNTDLLGQIAGKRVGDVAQLKILRLEKETVKELALKMKVTERPAAEELARPVKREITIPKEKPKESREATIGLTLKPAPDGLMKGLEVTAVDPKSPAAKAGIQTGDIILEMNRKEVREVMDLVKVMESSVEAQPYLARIFSKTQGRTLITAIDHPEKKN